MNGCPPCSSDAQRSRRRRARQKAGIQVVDVEVDQDVVEALLAKKTLPRDACGDRDAIAQAIRRAVLA